MANWTLEPPQSTPTARRMSIEASLILWYCLSDRVWIGATVMLSPVWTPMGSTFSMEHTMIALSFLSRMTSISNSFQPIRDSSSRASWVGLISRAFSTRGMKSSSLSAMLPPMPPRVNDGLMMIGSPMKSLAASASSRLWTTRLLAHSRPRASTVSLKRPLSSARSMLSVEAPMTLTPYFSSRPRRSSSIVRLRPVWPPIVERMASGPTCWKMRSTYSGFNGSRKMWSATPGVVMTVAGLGLIRLTS